MEWLRITLSLYATVFARAARLAARNWMVLGTVFLYTAILFVTRVVAGGFGMVGGFAVGLVQAACGGSFLYMVEMILRTSKVNWQDLQRSFGAYLWEVAAIIFVLWIVALAQPVLLDLPQGEVITIFVDVMVFVLLNAVPEFIYLVHAPAPALLAESYSFVAANWIEWFPANIAAGALLYAVAAIPAAGPARYAQAAAMALLLYFTMIMRGLLFSELHGSTYRARRFKYRMGA